MEGDNGLLGYVRQQRQAGYNQEIVRQACLSAGWPVEDVDQAVSQVFSAASGSSGGMTIPEAAMEAPVSSVSRPGVDDPPKWLAALSGGLVKTRKAADRVMLAIALVFFAISGYLVYRQLAPASTASSTTTLGVTRLPVGRIG